MKTVIRGTKWDSHHGACFLTLMQMELLLKDAGISKIVQESREALWYHPSYNHQYNLTTPNTHYRYGCNSSKYVILVHIQQSEKDTCLASRALHRIFKL